MQSELDLKKIVHDHGYKATPQRLAILSVFSKNHRPFSAEEIYKKLKKTGTDLVTIYRTLTSFEKGGVLKRVDLRKDSVQFELAHGHHHHIVCTICGRVEDFDDCDLETVTKKIVSKSAHFKSIREHSLELFGVCRKCS